MGASEIFGWMSPEGEFYPCKPWGHIAVVQEYPELEKVLPKYSKWMADLEDICDDCERISDVEGSWNAEWHRYEMAQDDVHLWIAEGLYRAGMARICDDGLSLHCEALEWTPELVEACTALATQHGYSHVGMDKATWLS